MCSTKARTVFVVALSFKVEIGKKDTGLEIATDTVAFAT